MNKILNQRIFIKLLMKLVSFWVLIEGNSEQGDTRERNPH